MIEQLDLFGDPSVCHICGLRGLRRASRCPRCGRPTCVHCTNSRMVAPTDDEPLVREWWCRACDEKTEREET